MHLYISLRATLKEIFTATYDCESEIYPDEHPSPFIWEFPPPGSRKSRTRFADHKSRKESCRGYTPQQSYLVPKKGSFLQDVRTRINNLIKGCMHKASEVFYVGSYKHCLVNIICICQMQAQAAAMIQLL